MTANAEILLEENEIKLSGPDHYKVAALHEIVTGKLAKRNVSLKNVESLPPDISPLGHARQVELERRGALAGAEFGIADAQISPAARGKAAKVLVMLLHGQSQLFEIVLATQPSRRLARRLHRGKQERNQDADDRNDGQEFHQRKGTSKWWMVDFGWWI